MKKVIVNGREITTNFGSEYPIHNGNTGFATMCYESMEWVLPEGCKYRCLEGEQAMFQRLVNMGYKRITFYRSTTRIRGYYDIIAFCKY